MISKICFETPIYIRVLWPNKIKQKQVFSIQTLRNLCLFVQKNIL